MRILMNRHYFVALPKCNQATRTHIVLWLKQLYPKELKNARMVTVKQKMAKNEIGILTRRTI